MVGRASRVAAVGLETSSQLPPRWCTWYPMAIIFLDGAVTFSPFRPTKPKIVDGILSLLELMDTTFAGDNFKKSMKKCFVDSCIAPTDESDDVNLHFKTYKDHKHGTLNPSPIMQSYNQEHVTGSVGMAVDSLNGITVETHTEAINADLSDDEDESEDESDDDDDDDDEEEAIERAQRASADPLPVSAGEWQGSA